MFTHGPGDRGSIPGWVKGSKMVLDATLLSTQHYKWGSRVKWSNPGNGIVPFFHLGVLTIEMGAFRSPLTKVTNFTLKIKSFHIDLAFPWCGRKPTKAGGIVRYCWCVLCCNNTWPLSHHLMYALLANDLFLLEEGVVAATCVYNIFIILS